MHYVGCGERIVMWCLFFFVSFYFVVKRLTSAVLVVEQTLALGEKTVDLSKRNLDSNQVNFLVAGLELRNLSLAYIRSLNLSYNNLGELPFHFLFQLENLTCLHVNDNRLYSLHENMKFLVGLQELDLRNNQLKKLNVVRELPKLKKLLVEGNPLTLEEIRSLIKHVDTTTRNIFVDIAGSVT